MTVNICCISVYDFVLEQSCLPVRRLTGDGLNKEYTKPIIFLFYLLSYSDWCFILENNWILCTTSVFDLLLMHVKILASRVLTTSAGFLKQLLQSITPNTLPLNKNPPANKINKKTRVLGNFFAQKEAVRRQKESLHLRKGVLIKLWIYCDRTLYRRSLKWTLLRSCK